MAAKDLYKKLENKITGGGSKGAFAQSTQLDNEVNSLLSKQKDSIKQYEASKKSGLLNMSQEEIQKLDSNVYKDTVWTETWNGNSHSYDGDFSTAQEKATALIGGAEEKRRAEYYKSLAAGENTSLSLGKSAKTLNGNSILSQGSRSGKNLLGL